MTDTPNKTHHGESGMVTKALAAALVAALGVIGGTAIGSPNANHNVASALRIEDKLDQLAGSMGDLRERMARIEALTMAKGAK